MAADDNILGLAVKISANPEQAQESIQQLQAKLSELQSQMQIANRATLESTQAVTASLEDELAQVGFVKDAWMQNAAAAREHAGAAQTATAEAVAAAQEESAAMDALSERYTNFGSAVDSQIQGILADGENVGVQLGATAAQAQEATATATRGTSLWHSMNQGVIGDLRLMRYAMYAFTTPLMFAYIIPEIVRMVEEIKSAISAMEGFDSAAQKAFADLVKGADEGLTKFQGLTTAQKIWQGQQIEAQTQQRINYDISMREAIEAQSYWHNLAMEMRPVLDMLTGNTVAAGADAAAFASQFKVKADALKDELQQEVLLSKQHQELAQLEKKLQQESGKSAHSTLKFAEAQQRMDEVIATAQAKLPPFISEIERLQKALLLPEGKENNTLFAYAEENAERLQEHLKPLEASFEQLGIAVPDLSMAGAQSPLSTQIQQVGKLADAQRLALPSMRELALANQELEREYPNLTEAERKEWAQVMLTNDAYRQHIDTSERAKNTSKSLADQLRETHGVMQRFRIEGEMAGLSMDKFSASLGKNAANAIVYGASFGQAMERMVKATIAGIAAQAMTWGLYYTAMGIADVFWNPARAAADFASAAEFFAIGGGAALVGSAIPGGGSSASAVGRAASAGSAPERGSLSGSPGTMRGEGGSGAGGSQLRTQTVVNIYGGQITDTHNLQNLAEALNQGGHGGTVRLNIAGGSHTIPAPVY